MRVGIPRLRSITVMAEAKYSQCPFLRSKRKKARGSATGLDKSSSIPVARPELPLDVARLLARQGRAGGELSGKFRNARVNWRQLQVRLQGAVRLAR